MQAHTPSGSTKHLHICKRKETPSSLALSGLPAFCGDVFPNKEIEKSAGFQSTTNNRRSNSIALELRSTRWKNSSSSSSTGALISCLQSAEYPSWRTTFGFRAVGKCFVCQYKGILQQQHCSSGHTTCSLLEPHEPTSFVLRINLGCCDPARPIWHNWW